MIWDRELEALASKVGNKNRVPKERVKHMVEHVFKCIRESMYDPTMPKILIHKFGTFMVKSVTLRNKLLAYQRMLDAGKISEEEYDRFIEQAHINLERIEDEGR